MLKSRALLRKGCVRIFGVALLRMATKVLEATFYYIGRMVLVLVSPWGGISTLLNYALVGLLFFASICVSVFFADSSLRFPIVPLGCGG